jgi:hypothetical protein
MKHRIVIDIGPRKKFTYSDPCVLVAPGDKIEWKLAKDFPYGIFVKAPISPLDWCFKTTGSGRKITATVSDNALEGHYPYGVGAFDGQALLFDDPEIIVRRP